jgi:DNA processing protein
MNTDRLRLARIALAYLIEPGSQTLDRLVQADGPEGALQAIVDGTAHSELVAAAQPRLAAGQPYELAEKMLVRTVRHGARVVVPEDDEWPAWLADLRRISRGGGTRIDRDTYPPTCIWVRGTGQLAATLDRSVSVVGSRASTSYGNHLSTEIAYGLSNRGWAVVSGGAFGVDAAAHRGALSAGGITVAVLACGVDRAYPAGNASLLDRIGEDGLLVSEWPLGAVPHRYRFLVRNRVIAALTRGTVMVEANARSGARQTLGRAAALGRAAMAVPGPVTSAMSLGCHQALRAGARLVTCYAEVLEEVGRIGDDLAPVVRGADGPRDRLATDLARVLDAVPYRAGADAGQIAASAGVPLRDALRALPRLQAAGFVEELDSGWSTVPARRLDAASPAAQP